MSLFRKWSAVEYNYQIEEPPKKRVVWLSLEENLLVEEIADILLNTSGLPDPFYHPVNLFLHYTRDNPELKRSVLYRLGINEFKGNNQELLSLLYMIVASKMWSVKLAREVCSVSKKEAIRAFIENSSYEDTNDFWLYPIAIIAYVTGYYPYVEVGSFDYFEETRIKNNPKFVSRLRKRIDKIYKYRANEVVILTEYYCGNYDAINKKRRLSLVHPYNILLYDGLLPVSGKKDKIESWILRWVNDRSYKMDMLPSNVMMEIDYIWDALGRGRYFCVANKSRNEDDTLDNSTDKELVEYLQYLDPSMQIVFKTRCDLIDLVKDTLDRKYKD